MSSSKQIKPDEPVGLKLTAAQRTLILDLRCLPGDYAEVVRTTPANQPVRLTLTDWEDLAGHVAAESNHTEDTKHQNRLDTIFAKIERLLDTHTH